MLGIDPGADVEEAEEAYHRLLRRYHPDLHQSGGPDALAAAEARTRALNAAMTQIRSGAAAGWRAAPSASEPGAPGQPGDVGDHADEADQADEADHAETGQWAGTAFADPPPVAACPFCGQPFAVSRAMKRHVLVDHHIRLTRKARPTRFNGRIARQLRLMRFVSVWYVLPINVLVALMIGIAVAPLDVQLGFWWFGIAMSPTIVILLTRGLGEG